MKLLTVFFLIFPCLIHAQQYYKQGSFVIKGHVQHFTEKVFDIGMTTYLEPISSSIPVKSDGDFKQMLPIQYRQDVYLYVNDEAITITVQDKDTITLNWDNANFTNTFSVTGNSGLRTKDLQLQAKLSIQFWKPFLDIRQKMYDPTTTAENKYSLLNDLYNDNIKALMEADIPYTENINRLFTGIYFEYTNMLQSTNLIPNYKLLLNQENLTNYVTNVAQKSTEYTQLNEGWFWNVPEYRKFIYDYVRFFQPFFSNGQENSQQKPFNPTLDQYYLALANINYTNIRDWFITKLVIMDFTGYPFEDVEKVYHLAEKTIQSTYLQDTLQQYYTAIKRLKPGNPAPGFTLLNNKKQSVSLSDFKGKVAYIDFWGVNCGPCLYDIENAVPKLHAHYQDKDVVFINICVDAKEPEWKTALEKYKLDGVNLIADGWTNQPVCKAYNISGIPHYILIDRNGKLVSNTAPRASQLNLDSGENEIDILLK